MCKLTANFGLRNRRSNCRLLKCISSGKSHSSFLFFASPRLFLLVRRDLLEVAKVKVDRGAGANSIFEEVAAVAGAEKSMVKGALAALGILAVAAAAGSTIHQQP
jgi:hypothetical protein